MSDVAIVGSGPNGLAAGVIMARAGLSVDLYEAADTIGGGLRSKSLFEPGIVHDICSAVHPMGGASRFFREFDLAARGVELLSPEVSYAHPLDGGRAGIAYQDLETTCARLGVDGDRWRRLMGPLTERSESLVDLLLSDQRRVPKDPLAGALLPGRILETGTPLSRRMFREPQAAAMLAGLAAHSMARLPSLAAAGVGLLLGELAHSRGWPIPRGGSQSIADAMAADFLAHGGKLHTGQPITDLRELREARAVLLDIAPRGLLDIAGTLLPQGYRRQLESYRYGPAIGKVDFLVSEPIPWTDPEVAKAGTVHLGGDQAETYRGETLVARGKRPDRPFTMVSEPMIADPSRGDPGRRPVWAYCHLPNGDDVQPDDLVREQIERFAPGFSETVLASRGVRTSELAAYNPNYVGGNISTGAVTPRQVLARPVARWNPFRTPLDGVYLCSAATPPGPGVHGMCGYFAAESALRREFGGAEVPKLGI
jgi:phytoene dehydrogenase-like protein